MTSRHPDDDGRVIVNMNLEGMKGYKPDKPAPGKNWTRRQTWYLMSGALKAALLATLIFSAVMVLTVVLLLKLWL